MIELTLVQKCDGQTTKNCSSSTSKGKEFTIILMILYSSTEFRL